jgi:hypothetical protein
MIRTNDRIDDGNDKNLLRDEPVIKAKLAKPSQKYL